jgi:uncharacterized protein YqgV (UPF0045/DUF77 family)
MQISAQISLYPLKQEKLSPAVEGAWKILEEKGLVLRKGGMSTVASGEGASLDDRHIFQCLSGGESCGPKS